jgi:hypothetical protein
MRNTPTSRSRNGRHVLAAAIAVLAAACGSNGNVASPDALCCSENEAGVGPTGPDAGSADVREIADAPGAQEAGPSGPADGGVDAGVVELPEAGRLGPTDVDLDGGALAPQDSGPPKPATAYCTSKPALPSVTDITGTWVLRALGTQAVSALGTKLHPKSVFYILTTITQSGSAVAANGHYCDRTEIDEASSGVTVIIPDKWAHTEKVMNRSGTLAVGADGVPVLNFPSLVEFAGARMSADTDPLPTTATDARVIDEDLDGNPGITVSVTGLVAGRLYSVQRQTTSIAAVAVAADRFEGVLSFKSEQNVIGSSPATLQAFYASAVAAPDTTPCSSTFGMVRVADAPATPGAPVMDKGGTPIDCTWVRAQEATLFPN